MKSPFCVIQRDLRYFTAEAAAYAIGGGRIKVFGGGCMEGSPFVAMHPRTIYHRLGRTHSTMR